MRATAAPTKPANKTLPLLLQTLSENRGPAHLIDVAI
jgi:hypothetical protein